MIESFHKYGPLRPQQFYREIKEGRDWLLVKVHGGVIYVPKWVFSSEGVIEENEDFIL